MWPMTVQLRSRYDIGQQVADDPLVLVVDDFTSPAECEHIISNARAKMKRGKVTLDHEVAYSEGRTGSTAWIAHDATPIIRRVVRRVGDLVGIPTSHAESLQVVHYAETQEYRAHHDAWKVGTDRHRERTENGGQRLVTALLYVNDVGAGGSTGFPKLDLEVEPIPGRMVLFHNTFGPDHDVHPGSLHGGMPVHYGEKWACNLWFRERPYARPGASSPSRRPANAAARPRPRPNAKKNRKSQKAARRRNR